MKNYPFIIVMLFASVLCNAQLIQNNGITTDKEDFEKSKFSNQKSLPIWEVTFEEETPVWTFGTISGTKTWAVGDTTPTNGFTNTTYGGEVSPLWLYMGWRYVHDYSESGNNFAWIDGISDHLGYTPLEIFESYIQFDNINLSTIEFPKVTFYQNYKKLNYDMCYVDFSMDDGISWTSVQVNSSISSNTYGELFEEVLVPQNIVGSNNVTMRFRWLTTSNQVSSGSGYGWELDDIKIVENPDYDIKLSDTRINFFSYIDYTMPENQDLYHYSSHYGKIPQSIFNSDYALMWFNTTVENNGNYASTPTVTVTVLDPGSNEIFTTTLVSNETIAPHSSDTIDLIEVDFSLGINPMIGIYSVIFDVQLNEFVEDLIEDNSEIAHFEITNSVYSRALNEPETYVSPGNYLIGGIDGEKFGSTFTFFETTDIQSMDIFISANSDIGAGYIGHIMIFDEQISEWVTISQTSFLTVEEEDLNTWKTIYFNDIANINVDPENGNTMIIAALELYYANADKKLQIGFDKDSRYSSYSTIYYFLEDYTWQHVSNSIGGLCINLNLGNTIFTCPDNISVCENDSPFQVASCSSCELSGPGISDSWFFPEIAGIGTHEITYTYNGGAQTCNFYITVNESPELKTVLQTPANGILEPLDLGTISVLDSDVESQYYVTRNNLEVTAQFNGNGAELILGDQFMEGAYQVWATNATSCIIPLGIINFVENTGTAKIVVSVDYGENPVLLNGDDVLVSLYQQITVGDETVITLHSTMQPGEVGQVIFDDLTAGTYFVSSSIGEFTEFDLNENVFYNNALVFDDATPIEITEGQIVFIEISHEQDNLVEGSNEGSGTVGEQPEGKSLNPLEGKAVVLKNADTQEIIDIALTDENGNYTFPAIPDNTNIQIFVTMPESPVWTAYNAETQTNQTLEVDFIVVGNSVYPSTAKIAGNVAIIKNIEIFPNPVAEILNIKSENNICEAVIYDISGRMLISVKGENITGISTQNISAGSYLLICTDKNGVPFVNKFVKE